MGKGNDVSWRDRKGVLAFTATLVAALLAVGVAYRMGALSPDRETARSVATSFPASPRAGKPFAFSKPAAPRPLPELRFMDGAGRDTSLSAFRARMVLLNIWATWCGPCREEMPSLDRLQARLGGTDFQVVPLSIDRQGLPTVKAFYRELGLGHLGIYVDVSGRAAGDLGIVGIPATLLVDRRGREIGRVMGPAEWDSEEVIEVLRRYLQKTREGSNANEP